MSKALYISKPFSPTSFGTSSGRKDISRGKIGKASLCQPRPGNEHEKEAGGKMGFASDSEAETATEPR
jgi:hypothetical protein